MSGWGVLWQCMNPPQEAKTNTYYTRIIECTGKVYSDPTGKFIQPSTQGNKYILVYYDYDSNHIFAEPMQNRTKESQMKAYKTIITLLKQRGPRSYSTHHGQRDLRRSRCNAPKGGHHHRTGTPPSSSKQCGGKGHQNFQKSSDRGSLHSGRQVPVRVVG